MMSRSTLPAAITRVHAACRAVGAMFSIAPSLSALVDHDPSSSSFPSSSDQPLTPFEIASVNLERLGAIPPDLLIKSVEPEQRRINYALSGSGEPVYIDGESEDISGDAVMDERLSSTINALTESNEGPAQKAKTFGQKASDSNLSVNSALYDVQNHLKAHRGNAFKFRCFHINADEKKTDSQFGAVIKIQLSAESFRVYSSPPDFSTALEAENECAKLAIQDGVMQYIETEKIKPSCVYSPSDEFIPVDFPTFYNTLPRPFPVERFNKMTDSNAQSYSHQWLKSLEGLAATKQINFSSSVFHIKEMDRFGCVLRVELSSESGPHVSKTYLVEPYFKKQTVARAAVKVQAMVEGLKRLVDGYFDSNSTVSYPEVTPAMTEFVNKQVWQQLLSSCKALKRDYAPWLDYTNESNSWGCRMRLVIPAEISFNGTSIVREYVVPAIYQTKVQARAAACCIAAEDDIVEFVAHRGLPSREHSTLALRAAALLGGKRERRFKGEPDPSIPTAVSGATFDIDEEMEEGELRDDVDVISASSSSANPKSTVNLPGQALKERTTHKGPGDANKRPRDHVGADPNEKSTKKRRKA